MARVIDTSVSAKWYFDEADSARANDIFLREKSLIAPEFTLLEFTRVVQKQAAPGAFSTGEIANVIRDFAGRFLYLHPDRELLTRAFEIGMTLPHPVYDCLYLALAESSGIPMVTADGAFADKTDKSPWRELVRRLRDDAST